MKTTFKTSFLYVLCNFVLINDVCADKILLADYNTKSANKEIKANPKYRKETIGLNDITSKTDYLYKGDELGRRLIKPTSFSKLEEEQINKDILDNIQDINDRKELKSEINDRAYPSRNAYDQYRDIKSTPDVDGIMDENALTKSWDKASEIKVVMYVGTTNEGHGMKGDSNVEKLGVNNTTLPPMICWEKNCPDCVAQESKFRCFVRGLLQAIVRFFIIGIVILLLFVCVCVSTTKKKYKSTDIKDTENEVVYTDDKTALIDPV